MLRDELEVTSQPDSGPLTPEQMSMKYLCSRSGVVKGIGMISSSSLRSTVTSSHGSNDEVVHLQRGVEEQQRRWAEQQRRWEERLQRAAGHQRQWEQQQQQMESMMDFMWKMGYPGPPPPSRWLSWMQSCCFDEALWHRGMSIVWVPSVQ